MKPQIKHIVLAFSLLIVFAFGQNTALFATNPSNGGEFHSYSLLSADHPTDLSLFSMDMGSADMFTAFDLYPNPSAGVFNLNFKTEMKGKTSLTIYNLLGKQIYVENLDNFKGAFKGSFDLTTYPSGFYFLQVRIGKEVYQHKLVLSKQ